MTRDWNDLDHDRVNGLIGDLTATETEYAAACKAAETVFNGSQTEDELADAAVSAARLTREDKIRLGKLATKDDAGRHFTEVYDCDWLGRMEAAGYITVVRPIHQATGVPYSREYWTVSVAPVVAEWFDDRGSLLECQYGGVRLGDLGTAHVWFCSTGQPAGCDLISEDGDPLELPSEDWWDLTGEIIDNQWQWDGEGHPVDVNRNTVQKITAFVPED